jgi:hypothetical protein
MKIETKLQKGGHPPQFRGENTFFSFQKNHKLDSNFSKLARFTTQISVNLNFHNCTNSLILSGHENYQKC